MRSEEEANRAIERYADTVRRICMVHLKNYSDTEDIFQTVFLKYILYPEPFESEEHEKAWIIRVTINACKDLLKSFFRSRTTSLDTLKEQAQVPGPSTANCSTQFSLCRKNIKMSSICIIMRGIPLRKSAGF